MPRPDETFVPGKPLTDIWATSGLYWRQVLEHYLSGPLVRPYLRFIRNDRSRFDLDNLVYPVVAASGLHVCESIWATVAAGPVEGVFISEASPPGPPATALIVRVERPSTASVAGRSPLRELADMAQIGDSGPLGLSLAFDDDGVVVGTLSFDGPTKSLIDDLAPLFGTTVVNGRSQGNDHRVKELRITRAQRPSAHGVLVAIWELADDNADYWPMVNWFSGDDAGYSTWIGANQLGYVLNCEPQPRASYLVLHRATCHTIVGAPARGRGWTYSYAKACARTAEELDQWATDRTGATPTRCGTCKP